MGGNLITSNSFSHLSCLVSEEKVVDHESQTDDEIDFHRDEYCKSQKYLTFRVLRLECLSVVVMVRRALLAAGVRTLC